MRTYFFRMFFVPVLIGTICGTLAGLFVYQLLVSWGTQ